MMLIFAAHRQEPPTTAFNKTLRVQGLNYHGTRSRKPSWEKYLGSHISTIGALGLFGNVVLRLIHREFIEPNFRNLCSHQSFFKSLALLSMRLLYFKIADAIVSQLKSLHGTGPPEFASPAHHSCTGRQNLSMSGACLKLPKPGFAVGSL